jgi:shikimate kinase
VIVALVGLPGSGKSSVARQLARGLGWSVLDTDQVIESRIAMPIRDFFSLHGEIPFRDLESQALLECLATNHPTVLATGGGIVLRDENREALRRGSQVFYLRTGVEELVRRLRHDTTRPLLQGVDPRQKLRELYAARDPLYRKAAHYVVEAHRPSVTGMAHWIQMQLELGGHAMADTAPPPKRAP